MEDGFGCICDKKEMILGNDTMRKQVIAHYHETYLAPTETFIYEYLRMIKAYDPFFMCKNLINLDRFPFGRVYSLSQLNGLWVYINAKSKKWLNRELYFEHLLKKNNARLIHAHFGPNGWSLLSTKRRLKVPLITTFYGWDMSVFPRQEIWQVRYRELFNQGDLFLVEGGNMKNKLMELGCPPEKIRIQRIAIDVGQFKPREKRDKQRKKMKILFCGRFVEKKGLIYALKALKSLINKIPDVEFVVVGDGDLRPEIEKFISENSMEKYITLMGNLPLSSLADHMRDADIMLQPSVTAENGDSEGGAPTVLLEAQATGLPVVSTFHADIPEVVLDGRSGFLCPERDPMALTEKIIYLIEHPEVREAMGKEGRRHVEANYNIYVEVNKLEQVYSEVIG